MTCVLRTKLFGTREMNRYQMGNHNEIIISNASTDYGQSTVRAQRRKLHLWGHPNPF